MQSNLAVVNMDELRVLVAENSIKNEIWDSAQAAEYLKVTVTTVKAQASAGLVPGIKIGKNWRFSSIALYRHVAGL